MTKTTDSALTGTKLRLLPANMGIVHAVAAGVVTDPCVSSTVRSLSDESFDVPRAKSGGVAEAKAARAPASHTSRRLL